MRPHAAATDTGVQPQPATRLAVIASRLFAAVANRYPQRPAVGMSPACVAGSIYLAVESAKPAKHPAGFAAKTPSDPVGSTTLELFFWIATVWLSEYRAICLRALGESASELTLLT
jgi:hypothetical protein